MRRFHRSLGAHAERKADLEELFEAVKGRCHEVPEFAEFVEGLKEQLSDLVGSMTHKLEVDFEAYNPVNFFHARHSRPGPPTATAKLHARRLFVSDAEHTIAVEEPRNA